MKALIALLGVSLLFGAGCARPTINPSPKPEPQNRIEGWQTYRDTSGRFAFQYPPNTVATTTESFPEDVAFINLGRTVSSTKPSVPDVTLHVRIVSSTDAHLRNGCYADSGWPTGYAVLSTSTENGYCVVRENGAAAGNYYFTKTYAKPLADAKVIVMMFVVHSVNCQNYDNPEKNCIAFDETRDTAIVTQIMSTFAAPAS